VTCTIAESRGLLDKTSRGQPLSLQEREHLDTCAVCRTACERMRRLVATWAATRPTDAEVGRARARWRRSRASSPSSFDTGIVRWAAGGAAIAIALVAAANRLERAHGEMTSQAVGAPSPPVAPSTSVQAVVIRGAARVPAVDGLEIRLERGESADVVGTSGAVLLLRGPGVVVLRTDETMACGFRAELLEEGVREPAPATATPSAPPAARPEREAASDPASAEPAIDPPHVATASVPEAPAPPIASAGGAASAWAIAAEAMRSGKIREADRAFADLSLSADPRERDAAKLARAELWMANGHAAEARPLLAELAASGATSLVRKRAQALLAGQK
jgi:hypothetical protein